MQGPLDCKVVTFRVQPSQEALTTGGVRVGAPAAGVGVPVVLAARCLSVLSGCLLACGMGLPHKAVGWETGPRGLLRQRDKPLPRQGGGRP